MNGHLRVLAGGGAVLAMVGLLASCENGGGAVAPVRLYFSTDTEFGSSQMNVQVDLASAHATLVHKSDGTPDCTLSANLVNLGCRTTFTETAGARELRVSINDCSFYASDLFHCEFLKVDLHSIGNPANSSLIYYSASETCNSYLDDLCVTLEEGAASCEDCYNGHDDDGDGIVDCADPNCEFTCVTHTTITCSTSTSTSTSTTTSTTTTTTEPASVSMSLL